MNNSQNKKKMRRLSKNNLKTAKRLLQYMTETYKFRLVLVFVCILISSVATISVSLSLKFLLDDFIIPLIGQKTPDFSELYMALAALGAVFLRLCIARALLKKPKILILDDSTSAVDTKTDALIRKAFREEIPDTTKIIIAQRVASVEDADQIIVLDGGAVSGVGTSEELLKTNNIYREVYESQVKGGEDNE